MSNRNGFIRFVFALLIFALLLLASDYYSFEVERISHKIYQR